MNCACARYEYHLLCLLETTCNIGRVAQPFHKRILVFLLQLAFSSQAGKAKEKTNAEARADDGLEIHVMRFSPSVYGSLCYGGFLLVYFHTDKNPIDSLLRAFKKTSGKDIPAIP